MPLVNLPANKNVLLVHAGDDPGIIINRDLVNLVVFGQDSAFTAPAASIIDALTFVQYSGDTDVWASGLNAPVTVDVQPNNVNWSPSPAQAAASIVASGLMLDTTGQTLNSTTGGLNIGIPNGIASTGVPLISNQSQIASQNSVGLAAGATSTSSVFNVNNMSFEFIITGQNLPIADATPYALVVLQWLDGISGLIVAKDSFVMLLQNQIGVNIAPHVLRGPNKGNQVKITIQNNSTTQAANFTYSFLTNSRLIYSPQLEMVWSHRLDGANSGSIPYASRDYPDSKVIATFVNGSLAASGTDTWTAPPHNGPAWFNFTESGVSGSNITVLANPLPNVVYGNTPYIVNDILVAGNPNKLQGNIQLPMGPVQWQIHNAGTVAANYAGMVVAQ